MAWISPVLTTADVIRQAATILREADVAQGKNPTRRLQYFDALNTFLQTLGRMRPWWWLARHERMVTKNTQETYAIRSQAKATVTISGDVADGDEITIDAADSNRIYEFDTDGSVTAGSVQVDVSGGVTNTEAIDALVAAINGDDDAVCYAFETATTEATLYWAGDDGLGKIVEDTTDTNDVVACAIFALNMADFSILTGLRWRDRGTPIRQNPLGLFTRTVQPTNGSPGGYALHRGLDKLQIYSTGGGAPDAMYLLELSYQAMPSAVMPDGQGQIDLPIEFQDMLPRAVALVLRSDVWDEQALLGEQWLNQRIRQLEQFSVDKTAEPSRGSNPAVGIAVNQDLRIVT